MADNPSVPVTSRITPLLAVAILATCFVVCLPAAADAGPWRGLAKRIASVSHPDSTAVLVLFDADVAEGLRSELPRSFAVVPFKYPDVQGGDAIAPQQLGQLYREASIALERFSDVWVVGRPLKSSQQTRVARFAEMAASAFRSRVLRDTSKAPGGSMTVSRWLDRPGGVAERLRMRRSMAYADSVIAAGPPKRVPITRPFSASELAVDPDTLALYLTKLPDTTYYSIGGCSEVELVFWNASERLGQLGPGVVPALVTRNADPNPFVRERVQDALLLVTQDERIMARTNGEYLKFYDQPAASSASVVNAWWAKFGHFWASADSTR